MTVVFSQAACGFRVALMVPSTLRIVSVAVILAQPVRRGPVGG
ncbi:hypothetical protein [Streptomyces sp. NPDC059894]